MKCCSSCRNNPDHTGPSICDSCMGGNYIPKEMVDEGEDIDPIVKYPMRNRMTGTTKDLIRREK